MYGFAGKGMSFLADAMPASHCCFPVLSRPKVRVLEPSSSALVRRRRGRKHKGHEAPQPLNPGDEC